MLIQMYARDKLVNVGSWWPPADVEKLDKAREGTYLSRSVFIRKAVLERLADIERGKTNEK